MFTRRDLLKASAAAAAGMLAGGKLATALAEGGAQGGKKIPVGLQMYSLREDAAKDLGAMIKAVAKIGYQGVEFAGYYNHSPKEIRKMLDDNGIRCCGTHAQWPTLQPDQLKATVEFNRIIGNRYLICPYLGQEYFKDVEATKKTADLFNKLAEQVAGDGMLVGYHAHGGDFRKIDGEKTSWEVFFENTAENVVMQLDTGNCLGGGGDPYKILAQFPGRTKTIHLKEHGGPKGTCVGDGDVDWPRVFHLCETVGGTEWYIVEQEQYAEGVSPLESVKKCFQNLKRMGKV
ncbi:sugar phosphate isomerase/epimerase [Thermostilla marina]